MNNGRSRSRHSGSFLASLAATAFALPAVAQCPSWDAALATGLTFHERPRDLIVWDEGQGAGPETYLAHSRGPHSLLTFGGVKRWHGSGWTEIGDGRGVAAFTVADTGTGPRLHAGTWRTVKRLQNGAWVSLGEIGLDVMALDELDDGSGPTLYAGGVIRNTANHGGGILAWSNGAWVPAGSGLGPHPNAEMAANALGVFDDGSGPSLYAGGRFWWPATGEYACLAKRVAGAWVPVPGLSSTTTFWNQLEVFDLRVFDDGSGSALYLAGRFGHVLDPSTWAGVLRYAGGMVSTVGGPMSCFGMNTGRVYALGEIRDAASASTHLLAAGWFDTMQGATARGLASWNGSKWTEFGGGFPLGSPSYAWILRNLDPATEHDFVIGVPFHPSAEVTAKYILRYEGCDTIGSLLCAGDGSGTACPCGNSSAVGADEGCLSSLATGGKLRATGTASLANDTIVLAGTQMPNSSALYFQGTSPLGGGNGAAFGDGLRCAAGTIVRLGTKANVGGASQYPSTGEPSVSLRGLVGAPGSRTYQVWYRNAADFCTPSTFNLSNGVEITWGS